MPGHSGRYESRFQSLPPSQIVPTLLDEGRYIASVSSYYRVLKAAGQQHRQQPIRWPEADLLRSDRPQSGLVLGHHLRALGGHRAVLLPVSGYRYFQPYACGLGSPCNRVRRSCR